MTDLSKFKDIYVLEVEEHLQKLNDNLLAFEKSFNSQEDMAQQKYLDELMRSSHTIKGSSASMGYAKMAFLTHVMEDVFDAARNHSLRINSEVINKVFSAIDALQNSLNSIKENDQETDLDALATEIKNMTGVNTEGIGKSIRNQTPQPKDIESVPEEIIAELSKKEAPTTVHELDAVARIDYIKVPVERLDSLMDLVEELLIDKMKLEQIKSKYPELEELSDHINLLTSSIQYQVMQARLVPVDQIFARFPRMIRDLSQKMSKKINFEIIGGEIELDRTIVDKLGEPLVHLLRNAVDHGILKKGEIKLRAIRESDYVLIEVENSDQGINFEKVKKAAVDRSIISSKEAEEMDQAQLANLLFHPHLSTKEEVTEVSGRGVGLSVVKQFAEKLGGHVLVSNLSPGAKFTLQLPLTVAILNALLIDVKNSWFAIPFTSIIRSVGITNSDIKKMADQEVAVIDGTDVPLIRLDRMFGLVDVLSQTGQPSLETDQEVTVVLTKKDNDVVGIVVDNLIGDQEITIKPLSPILRGAKGFSGSTILGDGRTILILDIMNLLKQ